MSCKRMTLALMTVAYAIGLLALVAALRASPSQAQQGTMHDCPPADKWSVAIWRGNDGTDVGEAFPSCGEEAVVAAYSLDPETQVWSRWFLGEPEVSTLDVVNDMQGLLAVGSTQATPVIGLPNPASVYCVEQGYELTIVDEPEGQVGMCNFPDGTQCEEWSFFEGECGQDWAPEPAMHNCPKAGKWAIAVWEGPSATHISQAVSSCDETAIEAAYSLDPDTQVWSRWFANKPEISSLSSLDDLQGLMALGAAAAATPTPIPVATTATGTATPTATATPHSGG